MLRKTDVLSALFFGLMCGFFGSIPIAGPTAVMVLERGLSGLGHEAFEIAVGAAVAEAVYALFAFLGMTAALSRFPWLTPASKILSGVILLGLGLYLALTKRKPPPHKDAPKLPRKFGGKIFLGLLATGVNPTLLATWSAVVTGLHGSVGMQVEPLDSITFALGVCVGIIAWFGLMLLLIKKFRSRFRETTMANLVRGMGWALVVCGGALLVNLLRLALV